MKIRSYLAIPLLVSYAGLIHHLSAATLKWDTATGDGVTLTDGTGTWGSGNWNNAGVDTAWTNGNDAVFGGGGTGTAGSVTTGTVSVNSLTFNTPAAGNYNLTGGTITMSGSSLTANADATISSVLAGTSGLSIGGTGVLALTGANSYSGGTTIASGSTVNVGNGGSTGSLGGGALVNNGTLTYNLVGASTVATLGAGGITGITGSGSTSITADTINFGASGGFTATTSGNQSYIATRNTTTYPKGMIFGTSGAYNFTATGGASITMKGDLGASAASTASVNLDTSSGNGAINLDISVGRANQFYNIGSITANAGTGAINWTGTYGAARGSDSSQTTPITLTGAINMTANFQSQTLQTLTLNAAGASTVTGNLLGSINVVKGGSQNLTLSGTNTYSGSTTVSVGRLIVSGASNTSSTSIASGAFLELNSTSGSRSYSNTTSFTGAGTLVKTGAGEVYWGGAATFNLGSGALIDVQAGTFTGANSANENWSNNKADLNVAAGATFNGAEGTASGVGGIKVDALSGLGTIKVGYTVGGPYDDKITFGVDNGTGTFDGVLADATTAGKFIKTGSGTQTLTGTSTATGSMTVNNGTLALGHATNTLANTMAITVDGVSAILSIAGNSDTVGAVTLKSGASITGSGGTLTGASYAVESGSISAILGGAVNLTKTTSGTVTLSGANTYTGSTTVSAGRLIIGGTSRTGSSSIASGAVLELSNTTGTRSFTTTTSFTGTGSLVKSGAGTVNWTGAATFNMSSGALIDVQAGTFTAAFGADDVWTNNMADLNVASGAIFEGSEAGSVAANGIFVNNLTGTGTIKLGYTDNGLGTDYANRLTFGVDNGSASFGGVLANGVHAVGKFVKTGTGTQTLTGTSTATGSVTVNNGTLALGHATNTLANTMAVNVDGASAILSIGTNSDTVGAVSLKNGAQISGSTGTLTGSSYAVESGTISAKLGGTANLTKTTSGTVTLSGANSYTGTTTINSGTLKLDAGGAIDNSTTIIVGNSSGSTSVLDVSTKSGGFTVGSAQVLQGSGSISGALAVSGTLAPGNSIESLGSGAVTFNNTSTYAYEFNTSTISADLLYSSGALAIYSGTTLTLQDLGINVALPNDTKFTLISYLDSSPDWTGGLFTLGSTTLADDSTITLGANQWIFNYNDTSGGANYSSDQTGATRFVTMTVVPEPGAVLLGGLGLLALLRRRRQD